jgi:hypothetical protein
MIDFSKISQEELSELKTLIIKNTEKSELEKFYLYDNSPLNIARIFLLCRRFIESAYNIIEDSQLKEELLHMLIDTISISKEIFSYLESINRVNFGKRNYERKLNILVRDVKVSELIDVFSLLLERTNILRISRLKGVIIEGKSAIEAKKVFGDFMPV